MLPDASSDERTHLHSIDRLHCWNVADAVLDGGNPWLPSPAQFRTCFLLPMPRAVLFLRRFAARAERSDFLFAAAAVLEQLCRGLNRCGPHVPAAPALPPAFGVCDDARHEPSPCAEGCRIGIGLCPGRVLSWSGVASEVACP